MDKMMFNWIKHRVHQLEKEKREQHAYISQIKRLQREQELSRRIEVSSLHRTLRKKNTKIKRLTKHLREKEIK